MSAGFFVFEKMIECNYRIGETGNGMDSRQSKYQSNHCSGLLYETKETED